MKNLLICTLLFLVLVPAPRGGAAETRSTESLPVMDLQGYHHFLEENKGKVVVVDFWATWCGPCRKKLPELIKCRTMFSPQELTLIGISLDFNPDILAAFLQKNPLNYPVYWAEENLTEQLGVQAVPLLHIYDASGKLRIVEEGLTPHESLCQNIDDLKDVQ